MDTMQRCHLFRAQYAQPGTNAHLVLAPQLHVHPVSTQPLAVHHVLLALLGIAAQQHRSKSCVLLDSTHWVAKSIAQNALLVALVLIQQRLLLLVV